MHPLQRQVWPLEFTPSLPQLVRPTYDAACYCKDTFDLAQASVSPVSDPRSPTVRVCHQEPSLLRLHVQRPHLLPGLLLREVPSAPHRRQETRSSLPRLLPRALRDSALRRGAGGNAKHIDSMSPRFNQQDHLVEIGGSLTKYPPL